MGTDELIAMAWAAEDAGAEIHIEYNDDQTIVRFIEIDGEVVENDDYQDELEDSHWGRDSYRVAEASW